MGGAGPESKTIVVYYLVLRPFRLVWGSLGLVIEWGFYRGFIAGQVGPGGRAVTKLLSR